MNEEEKPSAHVLASQVDALIKNLERIQTVMKSEQIKLIYRQPVFGKFHRVSNPLMTDLAALKTRLERHLRRPELTPDQMAQAWKDYVRLRHDSQPVFAQCLDFLGGIAVRDRGLDDGICALAEKVVEYFAAQAGFNWYSVMILGEERLFDTVAHRTQIIRLRFPEWDIWSLAFTVYELGQLVAEEEYQKTLRSFIEGEQQRIRQIIEDTALPVEMLDTLTDQFGVLTPVMLSLRQGHQRAIEEGAQAKAGEEANKARQSQEANKAAVNQFLEQQYFHMRSLFADAFATYFLGPAYLYARFYLRFMPADVNEPAYNPSLPCRIAVMLGMLDKMNRQVKEAERLDEFTAGPYEGVLKRFEALWSGISAEYGKLDAPVVNEPYATWFSRFYTHLVTTYTDAGFAGREWKKVIDLAGSLLNVDSADRLTKPAISPAAILNAGWECRRQNPDRVKDIETRIRKLLEMPDASESPAAAATSGSPSINTGAERSQPLPI